MPSSASCFNICCDSLSIVYDVDSLSVVLVVELIVTDVVDMVVVDVDVVPVGVVIGILVSTDVLSGIRAGFPVSELLSSSNPSGGFGIRDSHNWSLPPCRNHAGRGLFVVGVDFGTHP